MCNRNMFSLCLCVSVRIILFFIFNRDELHERFGLKNETI